MSEDYPVQPLRKPTELHVTVDSEQMKILIEQNKKLEEEKETMRTQIAESEESRKLLDTMKEKASIELTALGIDTEPTNIKTKEDLDRAIDTIQKLREKKNEYNPASGGSAPLSGQNSQAQNQGSFGSYPEMIDSVRDLASPSNKNLASRQEAQKILDMLMVKAIRGQKESNKAFDYAPKEGDKGTLQILRDKHSRRKALNRSES